jgi:hypothetical protein
MRLTNLLLVSALFLSVSACGGSSASSPSSSAQAIGPVILNAEQTEGEVALGNTVVFDVEDPGAWTLVALPAELVELTPGGEKDGAIFNPGAKALATGNVIVSLRNEATGEGLTFVITIK